MNSVMVYWRWLTGVVQAAGSWSLDACCAVAGIDASSARFCDDRTSSSDWLFGLGPGPPQRFEPTGTSTLYQWVEADRWPSWGGHDDLAIGRDGAPGGSDGYCNQGDTYRGTDGEICGGEHNWGATDVEVWYPRTGH